MPLLLLGNTKGCFWLKTMCLVLTFSHSAFPTEHFSLNLKEYTPQERLAAPQFLVPLKDHAVRRGHDCTMSCAFVASPPARVSWYKGDAQILESPHYWQTTVDGVCTLTVPNCGIKDSGEYTLIVENDLGKVKSKCKLVIFGMHDSSGHRETQTGRDSKFNIRECYLRTV